MKIINKALLDELVRLIRKYQDTGDADLLPAKHETAFKLSQETFGHKNYWLCFCDLVGGATRLKKGVPNCDIYAIFAILGLEVVPDQKGPSHVGA